MMVAKLNDVENADLLQIVTAHGEVQMFKYTIEELQNFARLPSCACIVNCLVKIKRDNNLKLIRYGDIEI